MLYFSIHFSLSYSESSSNVLEYHGKKRIYNSGEAQLQHLVMRNYKVETDSDGPKISLFPRFLAKTAST